LKYAVHSESDNRRAIDTLEQLHANAVMTPEQEAQLVGSKGIASELVGGKRRISRSQAQIFAKRFNVPYHLFLRGSTRYR
jgi:antitoxin component HigA of HigAB toxin-antitoxin module